MLPIWFVALVAILAIAASVARAEPSEYHNSLPIISHIPRQRVESTAIAAVGYSKRRHILEIEFVNGAVYRYLDVSLAMYRNLMSSESKARFYDFNIRRHYRSVVVQSRQKGGQPRMNTNGH
jgi:hypothetical protein